jgi:hypothetical protein
MDMKEKGVPGGRSALSEMVAAMHGMTLLITLVLICVIENGKRHVPTALSTSICIHDEIHLNW